MATLKSTFPSTYVGDQKALSCTLYVGGLHENVDQTILHAAFIPFGNIRTIEIPKDRLTEKHRGFAFLEFEEEDDAASAADNMHEAEIFGRVITVNLARTGPRGPGEGSQAIWKNDFFLRQQMVESEMTEQEKEQFAAMYGEKEVEEMNDQNAEDVAQEKDEEAIE